MTKSKLRNKMKTEVFLFLNPPFIDHPAFLPPTFSSNPIENTQVTLLEHWRTVFISSWMTMSTHLTQGPFSFMTCFFTMASNAMSGVKSPVLKPTKRKRKGNNCDKKWFPFSMTSIFICILILPAVTIASILYRLRLQ